MTAELYKFDGERVGEPVPEVVAMLERWLERARNGEVLAIAVLGVCEGAMISATRVDNDRWAYLLAAHDVSKHDMLREFERD